MNMSVGDVDRSLATLAAMQVLGANAASGHSTDDAAQILLTTNPPRANKELDALLRQAHQPTLRRHGDAVLLLQVLLEKKSGIAARAKKKFLGTVRGRMVANLSGPDHLFFKIAVTASALVTSAYWIIRGYNMRPGLPASPLAAFFRYVLPPMLWHTLKVAVFITVASGLYSMASLAGSAVPPSKSKKLARRLKVAAAAIVAVVACVYSLTCSTPLVFAAAALVVAYVVLTR